LKDNEGTYALLTEELLGLPITFDIDDLFQMVRCLMRAGFQRLEQLRGVAGNAWPTGVRRIRGSLDVVAKHVTESRDNNEELLRVWQVVERIFKSTDDTQPRVARPDNGGPAMAVRRANIAGWSPETKRRKLEDARMNITIDSVTGGRKSYVSASRGFLYFVKDMYPGRVPLPPQIDDLLLWSSYFKNAGTFATYCSAVKWLTEGCGLPSTVFADPLLRRAKTALRHITRPREKKWINGSMTQQLVREAYERDDIQMAMLFVAAYVFLARVPSELLTWKVDGEGVTSGRRAGLDVAVQWNTCEVRVHLHRRKKRSAR
jgi:hypothetical protein